VNRLCVFARINDPYVRLRKMFRPDRILCRLVLITAFCFWVAGLCIAQDQQSSSELISPSHPEIESLAIRVLKRADQAKCHPNGCTVLVENFTTPSGSSSRFGMALADSISAELLAQGNGIRIVDRSRLQDYLYREHIPSGALKQRDAARWLATQFHANAVLIGTIERLGDNFNLLLELLNVSNDKVGPQEAMQISIAEPQQAFITFEPYDAIPPSETTAPNHSSLPVREAGLTTSVPSCIHCPPPLYSNAARKVRFMGTVVLGVTVTEEGRATDIRILKGVPFGMNEESIKTVSGWSFRPATYGGKPISIHVPIEVTFRLY